MYVHEAIVSKMTITFTLKKTNNSGKENVTHEPHLSKMTINFTSKITEVRKYNT